MSEVIVRLKDRHIKVKGGEYVQDIVRCQDCINNSINCSGTENWCFKFGYDVEDDDFCSYGEREGERWLNTSRRKI